MLKVYYLPGIPEVFQRSFQIQIAHLDPENITLYGEGIFPRISLDLHRNLRGTVACYRSRGQKLPGFALPLSASLKAHGYSLCLVVLFACKAFSGTLLCCASVARGGGTRSKFDSSYDHCKLRLQVSFSIIRLPIKGRGGDI